MDLLTTVVNVPFTLTSLSINVFFVYCLVFADASVTLKQPRRSLLYTLVLSSVLYLTSLLVKLIVNLHQSSTVAALVFYIFTFGSLHTSMTTSVWLNFYYYTKIVPSKRAVYVWLKKNVKLVIYSFCFFERIWTLIDISVVIVHVQERFKFHNALHNSSAVSTASLPQSFKSAKSIISWLLKSYLILSVATMISSTAVISGYLIKHVQQMMASGQSCLSPGFLGQVRAAVTGVVQALLYLICGLWLTFVTFKWEIFDQHFDENVHVTMCNTYIFGTTLNLWVGQTVFRQRTVDILRALKEKSGRDDTPKT